MSPLGTTPLTVMLAFMNFFTMVILSFTIFPLVLFIFYSIHKGGEKGNITADGGDGNLAPEDLPSIGIIIPLYDEERESIAATVRSLLKQDYPKSKLHIYFVLEEGDYKTLSALTQVLDEIKEKRLTYSLTFTHSTRKYGKAEAMNSIIEEIKEDFITVFDADDYIPENYLRSAMELLRKDGSVALTARVYRVGKEWHARLLTIDTVLWYDIVLKSLFRFGGRIPFSGEGLTIKTSVLREIGGFPLSLTEDVSLALKLAERGYKISYLYDPPIVEKTPKNYVSQLKQRVRWTQGFHKVLVELFRNVSRIGLKGFTSFFIASLHPISAVAALYAHTITYLYLLGIVAGSREITGLIDGSFPRIIYYPALLLLVVGNLALHFAILFSLDKSRLRENAPYTYLLPIHWYVIETLALVSLFIPRIWRKTRRR